MNLLFAIVVFVVLFSVIGFDVQLQSGEVTHMTVDPGRAIVAGFTYIGMVAQAVAGLFNPATAAQTVSDSSSVVASPLCPSSLPTRAWRRSWSSWP